jgi:hypothetical protein
MIGWSLCNRLGQRPASKPAFRMLLRLNLHAGPASPQIVDLWVTV